MNRRLILLSVALIVGGLLSAFTVEQSVLPASKNTGKVAGIVQPALSAKNEWFAQTAELTHTVYLPLVAHICRSEPMPMGVQIYYDISDTSSTQFQRLVESNTLWVRKPIYWRQIEPNNTTPDNYNWSIYDTQYLNAYNNGLKIVATIEQNPDWAADNYEAHINSEYIVDFVEFVAAVVERYDGDGVDDAPGSPVVNYWELYNEPDRDVRWGHYGAEYANMLSQVYPAIKQANPNAVVLMGGLAYDWFEEDGGPFNRYFIDDVLAAGGGDYFDVMNFHYYPPFMGNWSSFGSGLIGKNNYLRAELAKYNVEKPVAVTETGWDVHWRSDIDDYQILYPFIKESGLTGEELQNRFVVRTFSRAVAADIKITNWFVFNDISPFYSGFVYSNFDKRPSFGVFQNVVAQLGQAQYTRTLTASELGSANAEGYAFARCQTQIYVVWTTDGSSASIHIPAGTVDVVDMYGNTSQTTDGADGNSDGITTVAYSAPVYIVFQ